MKMVGRAIKSGHATGEALVAREFTGWLGNVDTATDETMGWLGCVDPKTGVIIEKQHPLYGKNVAGKVLVFTTGKGSTVGSYTLYALKKNGVAPAALVCEESEPIVAVGAIISDIPMVDHIDIGKIHTGFIVEVSGDTVVVK